VLNLEKYGEILKKRAERPTTRGVHIYNQAVAKAVCDYLGVKEFGLWVGVASRIGGGVLKAKLDYCKERSIKNPRYLLACTKK